MLLAQLSTKVKQRYRETEIDRRWLKQNRSREIHVEEDSLVLGMFCRMGEEVRKLVSELKWKVLWWEKRTNKSRLKNEA